MRAHHVLPGLWLLAACHAPSGPSANSCATAAPPAAPGPDGCALICRAELPVRFLGNDPQIDVWVNDHPISMTLDTGASLTTMNEAAAKLVGLGEARKQDGFAFGVGGRAPRASATAQTIAFGAIRLAPWTVDVLPFGGAKSIPRAILGTDILGRYEVDLDMPHKRVTLYEGKVCPGLPPGWTDGGVVVPFRTAGRTVRGRQPLLKVTLEGNETVAMLDTGADFSAVDADAAARTAGTREALASELTSTFIGVGAGTARGQRHLFSQFSIGGRERADFEADVFRLGLGRVGMVVGENVIRQTKIFISYARRELRLSDTW